METDILKKAGLTESQAKGYLALIEHGALTPVELAQKTNEARTNGYAICEKLVTLGLATKETTARKAVYSAVNPTKLRTLIVDQQKRLKAASDEIGGLLPSLLSKFRLTSDQPGVISIEGENALKIVYDEIINAKQDLLIFPSRYDRDNPEVAKLIDNQIARQRKAGVKALSFVRAEAYDAKIKNGVDELLELKPLPEGVVFDAQIMIFGNTVVTTVFNHGVVSTIINSPGVASTLRSVFFALWHLCDTQ